MIRAAFPGGIPEAAYRPLLALLYEGMSFRTTAEVVSRCAGKPWAAVYNDVLGAVADSDAGRLSAEAVENVKRLLREHGYDEWLAKGE
jgi:hypothetical protein